ncbi:MAG: VWA domain-containing protein [Chloroflexi bacterium]|nr:VWA domain-containing protein [Chloroflexota bacterium]
MVQFRYSRWDGTQEPFGPDADQLLEQLSEGLFEHGDLARALRDLFRRGPRTQNGMRSPGLQDLMERLRNRRNQQLERYDLDSLMNELREKLDRAVDLERKGAERSVEQARQRMDASPSDQKSQLQSLMDMVQRRADDARRKLDTLPESLGGAIKQLSDHDFIDPDARREFEELLDMLRQKMMRNVVDQTKQALQQMTPEQQRAIREMLEQLNKMLRDRLNGVEPDFKSFMDRFGPMFGDDPPRSLDELLDRLQSQMAQMQSLFNSMSPEMRQELADMMSSAVDPGTMQQLAELGALMNQLQPPDQLSRAYPFMGEESLTLDQAMQLMDQLQQLDNLERSMFEASYTGDLDRLSSEQVERLIGPEAREDLERLREIAQKLEEKGYARRVGDRWEVTPRTIRKLGDKALREVFGRLSKARLGGHRISPSGGYGEYTGETKPLEFGDPFDINLNRSLLNSAIREGGGVPIELEVQDFEANRFEYTTSAATVMLLDQSSSTLHYGRWAAAKKVAMALQSLIQGQFPRDRLYLIGFSDYAAELQHRDLPSSLPNDMVQGTNMHHALMLARKLLSKEPTGTRQIIMITDGEPTAHLEDGYSQFQYPPSQRTILETLKEVQRCTRAGVVINTFMLARTSYLTAFIDYVTKINRGRAFYTDPAHLGDYVLVDYVTNRRKRVA